MEKTSVVLSDAPLDLRACEAFVETPEAGGIVVFIGTVRNKTAAKRVIRLEFEAYAPMALAEMRKIAQRALSEYPVSKIAIYHRTGILDVGDLPVVIAVSAPHRGAAFDACEFCIDTLKETVPIWKKEVFDDGEVWVAAHP